MAIEFSITRDNGRNAKAGTYVTEIIDEIVPGTEFRPWDIQIVLSERKVAVSESSILHYIHVAIQDGKVESTPKRGVWRRLTPAPVAAPAPMQPEPTPLLPEDPETTSLGDIKRGMNARFDELKALILGLKGEKGA